MPHDTLHRHCVAFCAAICMHAGYQPAFSLRGICGHDVGMLFHAGTGPTVFSICVRVQLVNRKCIVQVIFGDPGFPGLPFLRKPFTMAPYGDTQRVLR